MACLIALSTRLGVVWNVFATWGYSTLVMAFVGLQPTQGASSEAPKSGVDR